MTPNSSPPAQGRPDGGSIRRARAMRTRMIRRRVATGAAALFIGTWAWIAIELVSGHDPALAARKTSTVASSSAQSATSTSSTTSSGTSASDGTTGSSAGGATSSNNQGATSSVTTRQS